MSATGARAQRFPEVSFKTIEEYQRAKKTGSVPINTVDAYRKALSEQTNTLGQWRIIKDWIDDNRYVQLLGPWMKERLLFKRSSTTFTHEYGDAEYDDTNGYALPHGVYLKLQVTKDKLTYFIRSHGESACEFRYSDEWVDGKTGEAISFRNVITLYAEQAQSVAGSSRQFYNLLGSGDGHLVCDGQIIPIKWHHESYEESFLYTLEDGSPLYLGVGRTYIAIMGGKPVSYE